MNDIERVQQKKAAACWEWLCELTQFSHHDTVELSATCWQAICKECQVDADTIRPPAVVQMLGARAHGMVHYVRNHCEYASRPPVSAANSCLCELPNPLGDGRRFHVYTYYPANPDIPIIYGVFLEAGLWRCCCEPFRQTKADCEHIRFAREVLFQEFLDEVDYVLTEAGL